MRSVEPRLRPRAVRELRVRAARAVLVQRTRDLPELRGTADGRARGAPRRSRAAGRRARPAVGALRPAPAALSAGLRPPALPHGAAGVRARAAQRVSPRGTAPGARGRRDRHGDERAALWRGGERSPPFSHARPRRRLRAPAGQHTALPCGLAAHGRGRAPRRHAGTAAARARRGDGGGERRRGRRSARRRVGGAGGPLPGGDPRPGRAGPARGAAAHADRRGPRRAVGRTPRAAPRARGRLRPPCGRACRRGRPRAARAALSVRLPPAARAGPPALAARRAGRRRPAAPVGGRDDPFRLHAAGTARAARPARTPAADQLGALSWRPGAERAVAPGGGGTRRARGRHGGAVPIADAHRRSA